ncbi:TIGR03619 family F420-dependent LLM class oxidoreductase [Nakamurella lactea]|uniref:TIGR03619 family F420-dependent LLM class oxidoreductase n=1 Tax=Nakamurella lactea TaxID=459515 RepID=UPI0004198574|nr:TIGR03619 family F420-dependent LLM class oxidoreductase [Nakamurella lactea]
MAEPQITVGLRNFSRTPVPDWRFLLEQARAADDAGIDRVFLPDHVAFGTDLSGYADPASGGVTGAKQPTGADGGWLEALTTLGALAAVTSRVRLATNVLVVPLRRPVVLAKVAATLDALSHGRFELGAGVGWQEAEYRAAGVPFSRRGAILDETLAACQQLWNSPQADLVGSSFDLTGIHMMPKPAAGGVPVWIGGRPLPRIARRLARFGAGWIPWGATPESYPDAISTMRALVEAEGRDFDTIRLAYSLPTLIADNGALDLSAMLAPVPALLELGISDFRTLARVPHGYDAAREFLTGLDTAFRRQTHQR